MVTTLFNLKSLTEASGERDVALRASTGDTHMQALPSKKETATSQLWLYRSIVDFEGDANAGLVGPLIVTNPAFALPSKQPSDVAQTFVALFQVRPSCLCPTLSVCSCGALAGPERVYACTPNRIIHLASEICVMFS